MMKSRLMRHRQSKAQNERADQREREKGCCVSVREERPRRNARQAKQVQRGLIEEYATCELKQGKTHNRRKSWLMRHQQSEGPNERADQKREREDAVCQFVRSDHDATHAKPSQARRARMDRRVRHLPTKTRKQPQQEEIEVDASPTEKRSKRKIRSKEGER